MNSFVKGLDRRNTDCKKWDRQTQKQKENDQLEFWVADSDYRTCDFVIEALKERVMHGAFGYTFISDEYLDSIINWFSTRHRYFVQKEWIIPSYGVVTSLHYAISSLTDVFDNILITAPVYNPFYDVVLNNNRTLLVNELIDAEDHYEIDYIDLEEKLKLSKMYILCNPHNPVGKVYTKEEVSKIVGLCMKYDVILVSDEIHCDITFEKKVTSVGNYFSNYDKIIVCTAASKTFNIAGLKNSNMFIKNDEIREKVLHYQNSMFMYEPNILGLVALKAAYDKGSSWVDLQNEYLKENRDIIEKYIKEEIPSIKVYHTEGTYLAWINMKSLNLSQDELVNGLYEAGIHINSGTFYSNKCIGYIRFNFACGRDVLLEGLHRLKKFVQSMR